PLEQVGNRLGGLGADAEPVASAVAVDLQHLGLADGVVVTDDLNKLAVAGRARVRHHHAIAGLLGLAGAAKTDLNHECAIPPELKSTELTADYTTGPQGLCNHNQRAEAPSVANGSALWRYFNIR